MDDDINRPSFSVLTSGQQALYDLCKRDLESSRADFEQSWSLVKGQQFLVDLRRMENTLHKLLAVQGDAPHLATNVYVVAQALTSILSNPRNMCFGNSVLRYWSWAGAHAEDQSIAWGRTHGAVRQFLGADQPSLLHNLDLMHLILQHFQEGTQADVGDFAGLLWNLADSTFFGGKFFHVHPNGRLEHREQVPLNMLFPHRVNWPSRWMRLSTSGQMKKGGNTFMGLWMDSSCISNDLPLFKDSGRNMTVLWISPLVSISLSQRMAFMSTCPPTGLSA